MSRQAEQFKSYAEYHQHPGNKMTHYFGIPMIFFSSLGLLSSLAIFGIDLGLIAGTLVLMYYLSLSFNQNLIVAPIIATMYAVAYALPLWSHWVLFIVGWILQGIGHYHYEKKSPAFLTNLEHLLIGPLWIVHRLVLRK